MKIIPLCLLALFLTGCGPIDQLLMEPSMTAEQWCQSMPCVNLLGTDIILNQPFSSLLVYVLGGAWLWAAWRFWKTKGHQKSKYWWSVSLFFGGIAALSAGTSYQAFGYELKCAGRALCHWTSWWEIAYMVLQVGSFNSMLVAVAYSGTQGRWRKGLCIYAALNFVAHLIITMAGALLASKFLISFELLVLFTTPTFILYFVINGWRYLKFKQKMDLVLLGSWVILVLTNALYFAYLLLGYTQALWQQGIWFSENDVLHVLVMGWVIYTGVIVNNNTQDHALASSE